jgi:hypothetical protein
MPLELSLLADPEARRHALELVLATQDGSEMLAGPYSTSTSATAQRTA